MVCCCGVSQAEAASNAKMGFKKDMSHLDAASEFIVNMESDVVVVIGKRRV